MGLREAKVFQHTPSSRGGRNEDEFSSGDLFAFVAKRENLDTGKNYP